jgi:polyisoprenoid-binding protein YceI
MKTQFKILNGQNSIAWTGRKVTGAHNGTIDIKNGELILNDEKLTGGNFTIDTGSIKILDITDDATNEQFAGHLASADFFSSEKYPESQLIIYSAEPGAGSSYRIHGALTIKGITHPIDFDAKLDASGEDITASAKLNVDRTKYDMKFRSGNFFQNLGDNLIYNDFELDVHFTAKKINTELLA